MSTFVILVLSQTLAIIASAISGLTGRYILATEDLDALIAQADKVVAEDLWTLRIRGKCETFMGHPRWRDVAGSHPAL